MRASASGNKAKSSGREYVVRRAPHPMTRYRLFLLKPDFADPAYPGQRFYCWHCALLEGVLASFPALQAKIDVERIPWPRPRQAVVAIVGEDNQSLPMLVLAADAPDELATGSFRGQ